MDVVPASAGFHCAVCGEFTSALHLGVGCRACTVFYRRAKKKDVQYKCKSGTDACEIEREESASCKRCRFQRFSNALRDVKNGSASSCTSSPEHSILASPSSTPRPVMERLLRCYDTMCKVRAANEVSHREDFHVFEGLFDISKRTLIKATYETHLHDAKVFYTALFDFTAHAFDEFTTFSTPEQYQIVRNFHEMFGILSQTYRTLKFFPDQPRMAMTGIITYFDYDDAPEFFVGEHGNIEDAKKLIEDAVLPDAMLCRSLMQEVNLTEEELVVMAGLELWDPNTMDFSNEVLEAFERNRQLLLGELHSYYREVHHMDDYAARIGKLHCLSVSYKPIITRFREQFEMFRLLRVIDENNLVMQMYNMNLL